MAKITTHNRITFRMSDKVHRLLAEAIEQSDRSMNAEINQRLLESFEQPELIETIKQTIKEELSKK